MTGGRARVELSDLGFTDAPTTELLRDLDQAVRRRAAAEARVELLVQQLRAAGASWTVVGEVLGTSRSAAQKRYGGRALAV